jgi:hypothetical protein
LPGKPEGKGPIRKTRPKQEKKIKRYVRYIEGIGMNWIHLAQDRK